MSYSSVWSAFQTTRGIEWYEPQVDKGSLVMINSSCQIAWIKEYQEIWCSIAFGVCEGIPRGDWKGIDGLSRKDPLLKWAHTIQLVG